MLRPYSRDDTDNANARDRLLFAIHTSRPRREGDLLFMDWPRLPGFEGRVAVLSAPLCSDPSDHTTGRRQLLNTSMGETCLGVLCSPSTGNGPGNIAMTSAEVSFDERLVTHLLGSILGPQKQWYDHCIRRRVAPLDNGSLARSGPDPALEPSSRSQRELARRHNPSFTSPVAKHLHSPNAPPFLISVASPLEQSLRLTNGCTLNNGFSTRGAYYRS